MDQPEGLRRFLGQGWGSPFPGTCAQITSPFLTVSAAFLPATISPLHILLLLLNQAGICKSA